jgi:pimeloyl-ACP methyl ester carboxylesterase
MHGTGDIRGVQRSNLLKAARRAMAPLLIAAGLAVLACSDANACSVKQWRFAFGQQNSAQMSATSGAFCQTILDSPTTRGGVRSVRITAPPRNGTATALGRGLVYKSNSGFAGRDAFSFAIIGGGKGAQRIANVRMSVAVAAPKGAPLPRSGPITLHEYTPWLVTNRGPAKAVGVFYFIAGLTPEEPDDDRHQAPQYFLKSLAEAGWDIVYAKYPQTLAYPGHEDAHRRVAEFIRARVQQLKDEGYRRVILGGQSWGAWATLVAERNGKLAADALFLMAPATYGARTALSGRSNLSFHLNRSEFAVLVKSIEKPTAAVFFSDDAFDPGGRAKLLEDHLRSRRLAGLVIDSPSGIKGHNAGWIPAFDFRYGKCLEAFFETLTSERCEPRTVSTTDFRAIANLKDIPDSDAKRIVSPEQLVGRSYVVYSTAGSAWKTIYQSDRAVALLTPKGRNEQGFEFKDGQHCRENQCRVLVKWDDKHLISFDPKSGAATSWWIETNDSSGR